MVEYEDRLEDFKAEFNFNDGEPFTLPEPIENTVNTLEEIQTTVDRDIERLVLVYVIGQWLVPHHQQVVHAWVDRFFHAGTTTTSRLEGSHGVLKA